MSRRALLVELAQPTVSLLYGGGPYGSGVYGDGGGGGGVTVLAVPATGWASVGGDMAVTVPATIAPSAMSAFAMSAGGQLTVVASVLAASAQAQGEVSVVTVGAAAAATVNVLVSLSGFGSAPAASAASVASGSVLAVSAQAQGEAGVAALLSAVSLAAVSAQAQGEVSAPVASGGGGGAVLQITGTYVNSDLGPASGSVMFTLVRRSTGGGFIVVRRPIVFNLVAGVLTATLPPVDPPYVYEVRELLVGSRESRYTIPGTGNIDLSQILVPA